ncbi:MAG: hypothetical protein AAF567_26400 [Actinomycetota bacterium]
MNTDIRIYVSSIVAVTALFFVGIAVPCGLAFGWPAGIGLGAMCAFWGGPGFGVMVAGARRELAGEHAASPVVETSEATRPEAAKARSASRLVAGASLA